MKQCALSLCAALLFFAGAQSIQAQVITNGEIERGLRYRGTTPLDGEPYTQRYSYGTRDGILYLNGDARQLYYLDYLDKADRAEKFGYRMPIDPYFETPHQEPTYTPVRVYLGIGGGYGHWRRR